MFEKHAVANNNNNNKHLSSWSSWGRALFPSFASGFDLLCACLLFPRCFTCSMALQGVQWA